MIETAALINTGELQALNGVGDLLQVLRRQVQIPGCHLQILMAEQKLDGAQVGTGFEQMRGPGMANQVRRNSLANAGPLRCLGACTPNDLVADGLLVIAMHPRREQIDAGLEPSPVDTQVLEQGRAQGQIAVLVPLAVHHMEDHALAVDVGDLDPGQFGAAHAGSIKNRQQRALKQAAAGVDQTCDFFLAEDAGQLPRTLRIGKELAELMTMKRAHVEEPQCGHVLLDASRTELELPEQISLVAAQIIRTELVRRLAEVLCEPLDEAQITPRRAGRVVATLELFEHHFAKTSHSVLPPVTHTPSRPQNYSIAHAAAAAAPAASFSPATRKEPQNQVMSELATTR